jgi:hypothetical protein
MVRAIYGDAYNDLPIITNTFSDPPVQVTKQNIPYGFFQKALFKIAPSRFNYTYTEYNMLRYPELERLADELTDFLKNWIEEELK